MREAAHPLTAREAYTQIVEKSLYAFHAKDPQHVVLMQIRRHCVGIDFPSASSTKHFELHGDNRFSPLPGVIHSAQRGRRKTSASTNVAACERKDPATPLVGVEKDLWTLHAKYLDLFRKHMLSELRKLTPSGFEAFARDLLEAHGYEDTHVTAIYRDGGIDGHGKLKVGLAYLNVAFQCKNGAKETFSVPRLTSSEVPVRECMSKAFSSRQPRFPMARLVRP